MSPTIARLSLLAALSTGATLGAQGAPSPAGATAPVAPATAVRASDPPAIDGRDDDAVWRTAPASTQFLEFQPTEGKEPRYRTEFRVAYDDRNLYVFVRAFDPHPDSIMTALTRRDERGPSDQVKIMIDAYNDRRSGFEFAVNPVGVKRDYAMYNDADEDDAWDGIWDVGTLVDSLGWTAEFRIPFSQLRYANKPEHVFGFGVWRDIERFKERTSWPLYRSTQGGISSQLGRLEGIRDITPFRRLEIVPYVVAKSSPIPESRTANGDPIWGSTQKLTGGADVKYGITPNLTLDATVNPDFGQVEADPSVVNLSAFETFFQERRPFFIEGTGLYRYDVGCSIVNCNGEGLFYSRRIGRSPQLFNDYADDGSATVTPILAAAKLTGRLPSGLNVGALEAVTGRVVGTRDRTTEPLTSYTVLRAQQDLRQGATSIGVIATGVDRRLDEWTDQFLRRSAYALGANVYHRWGKSRWEATASAIGSTVRGTPAAIASTQTSGVHLYQRPDAGLPFDSTRTSLAGNAFEASFGKQGGNMVRFQSAYSYMSPGLELNDIGFLRRANQQAFTNWMGLRFQKPTKVYRQMFGNLNLWGYWTADGLTTDRAFNTNWHVNLVNNMWVHVGTTLAQLPGSFCDNCARGGPAFRRSPFQSVWAGFDGDDRRRVVPSVFAVGGRGDYGASEYFEIDPSVQFRPLSQLQLTLQASWSRNHDDSQWFRNFTETSGLTHYAFARLEQETRSLGVRASYTATPALTLQLYAAPFLSRGKYMNVRELSATPRARRYEDRYTPYTPPSGTSMGFDVLELRSNSVLRWEFRPGSTMFVVWTHGRSGFEPKFRDRPWSDEYNDLFGLHPANTFLVKLAYWID
ncbi:MAG TPA: DUF5916 domain-containing protein [Gemmatimonadaceae bacterium]|nr:DUF5916 domain-containing protein [Gemmatimonadaceae bacterium]